LLIGPSGPVSDTSIFLDLHFREIVPGQRRNRPLPGGSAGDRRGIENDGDLLESHRSQERVEHRRRVLLGLMAEL
jgi:hypothetical protein